jgi:hypothetical protein
MKKNALFFTIVFSTVCLSAQTMSILDPDGLLIESEQRRNTKPRYNDSLRAQTTREQALKILNSQGVDTSNAIIQHHIGGYDVRNFAEIVAKDSFLPNYSFARSTLVFIRDYGFPDNYDEMQRLIRQLDSDVERKLSETRQREKEQIERGLKAYEEKLQSEIEKFEKSRRKKLEAFKQLSPSAQIAQFEKLQREINKYIQIQSSDLQQLFEIKQNLSTAEDRASLNLAFGESAANARQVKTFIQKLFLDTGFNHYIDLSKLLVIDVDSFRELEPEKRFEHVSDLNDHLKHISDQFSTDDGKLRSNLFHRATDYLKQSFVVQAFAKGYRQYDSKKMFLSRSYYYNVPTAEKNSIEASLNDKNLFSSRHHNEYLFNRINGYANKDSILKAELGTYAANKILTAANSNYRYVLEGGVAKKITQKEVERRQEQAERIAEIEKRNKQLVIEEQIKAEKEQAAFERRGLPTRLAKYNTLKESLQRIETKFNTEMTYLFELVNNLSNFKSRSEANGNARFDLFRSINYAIGMSYYDNANSPEDFIKLLLRANGVVSNLFDFSKLKIFTDAEFKKLSKTHQESTYLQLSEKIKTMEAILGADQNRSELLSKILDRLQKHMTVIKYISGYFKQIPSNSYLPSAREVVNELSDPRLNEIFSRYLEHFDARFTPFKDNIANVDKAYSIIKDTMGNNTRGMTKLQLDAQKKAKESALKETQEILGAVSPKNGKVNSLDSVKSGGFDIKSLSPTELAKACKALF